VLILATLLIGPEVKGSRRWITLIGINIQASESPSRPSCAGGLAVCGIGAAAGNAGDVDGVDAAADAGVAVGAGAGFPARPC